MVKGCAAPEVCNSFLFPDLQGFARRFIHQLFGKDFAHHKTFATTDCKDLYNMGIQSLNDTTLFPVTTQFAHNYYNNSIKSAIEQTKDTTIESITLSGFSRGAVTCFEIAKVLNEIAPDIPVDIIADQPVPKIIIQTSNQCQK